MQCLHLRKFIGLSAISLALCILSACGDGGSSVPDSDGDVEAIETETSDTSVEDPQETDANEESEESLDSAETEAAEESLPRCAYAEGCHDLPYTLYGAYNHAYSNQPNIIPFPYNYFTTPDTTAPTGLRLNLTPHADEFTWRTNTLLIDKGIDLMDPATYVTALNSLDGFAAGGVILVALDQPLADGVLPSDPADSTAAGAPLLVVDITPDSPSYGKAVEYRAEVREAWEYLDGEPEDVHEHLFWYLAITTIVPLRSGAVYGVFLTSDLVGKDGTRAAASDHFRQVWGIDPVDDLRGFEARDAERLRLASLKAFTEQTTLLDPAALALAFDFTTQSADRDLAYIADQVRQRTAFDPPDLDWDDDGTLNYYAPADYPSDHPSLPSLPGRAREAHIGAVVPGVLSVPEWRHYQDKRQATTSFRYQEFKHDENWNPIQNGTVDLHFWLFIPENAVQPMPIVMVQHGINSHKESVMKLTSSLAEMGVASIYFDFPYHGTRVAGAAPLEYIDVVYPGKAACAFKESVAEHLYILRALAAGAFDVFPGGAGDDVADFDPAKIGYIGTSLGSIVGEASVALSPEVSFVNFNVGGARLMNFVQGFLTDYGMAGFFPDYYFDQFAAVVQTTLESGDPSTFLPRLAARQQAGELNYLFTQSMQDETLPWLFTVNFGLIARPTMVGAVHRDIYGCKNAGGPYQGGDGLYQYENGTHNVLWSDTYPGPQARAQLFHFISTFLSTGTGEIIDPLASDR